MAAEGINAPAPPVGVIEALAQGFETVGERLILVLVPLLLDLCLWLGPRVSFAPVIDSLIDTYYTDLWQPFVVEMNPEMAEQWPALAEALADALGGRATQYFPLSGIPVLLAGHEAASLPFECTPPVWEVRTLLQMVGIRLASLLVGLVLLSLYISLIAQQVKEGYIALKRTLARLPVQVLWLGIFALVLPIMLLVIYLPFALLTLGVSPLSGFLAFLADWAGRLLALWIALFMVFTVHSLFMRDRSLPGALWDSVRVVQWNVTPTFLLMLLIVVIYVALTRIWGLAPAGTWLVPVGIVGHAFVSTALIAASFVFFKDRYRYWHEMRTQLLMELERRRTSHG